MGVVLASYQDMTWVMDLSQMIEEIGFLGLIRSGPLLKEAISMYTFMIFPVHSLSPVILMVIVAFI